MTRLAIEATDNSRWFREQVQDHVACVVVVTLGKFEVIRRSVKKTDRNNTRAIAFPQQGDIAGGPGEKQNPCGTGERDRHA